MSIRTDPLDELVIPDGTTVEEHDLVTAGDVFVGGQSVVEFGLRGNNVVAGERVRFGGDIEAEGDCRLDMWCDVGGNVLVGEDAYLGERVHVGGQLVVAGDLDIGDDVDIEEGFEANGWIVIRNPMPTIVFLFVYLSQLLRIGEEESAQEVVSEVLEDGDAENEPVVVPRSSRVNDDTWRVSTPARIGENCRLHGNIRATDIEVGGDTELFGSLRAKGDVSVEPGTVVHGDLTTRRGTVRVGDAAQVRGDISCNDLLLHDDAEVDGAIRARGEMSIIRGGVVEDDPAANYTDRTGNSVGGTDETPDGAADDGTPDGAADDGTPHGAADDGTPHGAEVDETPDGTEDDGTADGTEDDGTADGTEDDGTADGTEDDEAIPAIVRITDRAGSKSFGNGDGGLIPEAEQ